MPANISQFLIIVQKYRTLLHDLKNILMAMSTGVNQIDALIRDGKTEAALRILDSVSKKLESTRKIVHETAIEEKTPVNLNNLLADIASEFTHPSITYTFDYQHGSKFVLAKYTDIYRCVQNIFKNAVEAIAQHPEKKISGSVLAVPGGRVHLSIWNSGPKITQINNSFEHIFKPGYTTKKDGSGLGLDSVRSIVKSYDGSIIVRNKATGGVEFVLVFPEHKPADLANADKQPVKS